MTALTGAHIGVLVESDHILREIHFYRGRFEEEGATVHLLTRFWGGPPPVYTDHDFHAPLSLPVEDLAGYLDRGVGRLSALLVPGGFVADRLRYAEKPGDIPPALELLRQAFAREDIVKGAICHGLWLVSLLPELIAGRQVTCHNNLVGDVRNMGARYTDADVVEDGDLITARTADQHPLFAAAIIKKLKEQKP
ncbi:MAG: DJ-1/PfpI family protein [Segniliparus sp.]|uniref:DJ-1/PfpI family protein n=1 Tax=Segniliparus sp. TaxID=2804064 RepID=UPI003F34BF61